MTMTAGCRSGARRWWLLAAGCALLAAACSRPAPEQALRQAVDGLGQAIRGLDAPAVHGYLAGDFIGPDGMDRDEARRIVALYRMRYRSVRLAVGPLEVEMREPHATVRFLLGLGGRADGLLPESASLYRVETGWRLEDGEWRITSARWSRSAGTPAGG